MLDINVYVFIEKLSRFKVLTANYQKNSSMINNKYMKNVVRSGNSICERAGLNPDGLMKFFLLDYYIK